MKARKVFTALTFLGTSAIPAVAVSCSQLVIGSPTTGWEDIKNVATGIRAQGSSSVLPIISALKPALQDFQYEGTGSGDGLKVGAGEIADKDFGMTSSLKNPTASQKAYWVNHKIRTITFAIDAIGVALNMPDNLQRIFDANKTRPIINGKVLGKLYNLDTSDDHTVSWSTLLENPEAQSFTQNVQAMGRTGGKESSGTADGFFSKLPQVTGLTTKDFDLDHDNISPSLLTAEANATAKQALESHENTLGYLSLGFALANESSNLKVATIDPLGSGSNLWNPSIANVLNHTYNWTRPFNMIYSIENTKAISLAKFMLKPNVNNQLAPFAQVIQNENFIPLTELQINSQQDFASKSDADLFSDVTTAKLGLEV